jgi:phosphomannomutase
MPAILYICDKFKKVTLIKSISGTRGTIGGISGQNLTAMDIVSMTAAFAERLKEKSPSRKIVIGRDARLSGPFVAGLVSNTLLSMGFNVVDLGLSTTPTVAMWVTKEWAVGGIVITASHNPREWNALKFLNENGEFISAEEGEILLNIAEHPDRILYAPIDEIGKLTLYNEAHFTFHLEAILKHPMVQAEAIRSKKFHVVIDPVNSTGALYVPMLLNALGCTFSMVHGSVHGDFEHNPEPLPEHLTDLCEAVKKDKASLGIAVDPDVDRLALVDEKGQFFGEEYTLVAVAAYALSLKIGNTVSNLSSTRALRDITVAAGGQYVASAVGEVNVVQAMKNTNAIIGGEGNGGVIVPDVHYGRDAFIGIALFLSLMATSNMPVSEIKKRYPVYQIIKDKMLLPEGIDLSLQLDRLALRYTDATISRIDGLKLDFEQAWVHLRASNTEPILRIYAEADTIENAKALAEKIKEDFLNQISK